MSIDRRRSARGEPKRTPRARTAKLTADRVEAILRLIDRLPSGSSWAELTVATSEELGLPYTRQALSAQPAIRLALKARKNGIFKAGARRSSPGATYPAEAIDRLKRECAVAKETAEMLIERHLIWIYNAHAHGLTQEDLDKPLPPPGRA